MTVLIRFIFYCLLLMIVSSKASIASELEQFKTSNSCPHCNLSETDLSFSKHNSAYLKGVRLDNANLEGTELDNADLRFANLESTYAHYAMFRVTIFDESNLRYFKAYQASFSGASFKNAILSHAQLERANLSNADFTGACLKEANFSYSILIGATISTQQLKEIKSLSCAVLPDGSVFTPNGVLCKNITPEIAILKKISDDRKKPSF